MYFLVASYNQTMSATLEQNDNHKNSSKCFVEKCSALSLNIYSPYPV